MSCGCSPPSKASLWTPIPGFRNEILPGENIDCYNKRAAADGLNDDSKTDLVNRIQNTSLNADAQLKVNEQLTLSAGPRTATSWAMSPIVPGLTFTTSGKLTGTVAAEAEGKTYKISVTAKDTSDIDTREFTFNASKPDKSTLSFIMPYVPSSGNHRISSKFGPRSQPTAGASTNHKGIDLVAESPAAKGKGTIVAAADGEVVAAGNAGGYGLLIRINHKDSSGKILATTMYGHNSKLLVTAGQKVSKGQTIAKEGSTGASSGPHLHFELRLGGTLPTDPVPYIKGQTIATPPVDANGRTPPDQTRNNPAPALTKNEVEARTGSACPTVVPTPAEAPTATKEVAPSPFSSVCCKDRLSKDAVIGKINQALGENSSLTAEDKKIILFIAKIESGYNECAKNPSSSALGLYQMLDATAKRYYSIIGSPFTCESRTDPYLATKAMIQFYLRELKKYWTEYKSSGKMAGKTVANTPHTQRYGALTQAEFSYGLIHHDGVGTAVSGRDAGGVSYFQRRAKELGYP